MPSVVNAGAARRTPLRTLAAVALAALVTAGRPVLHAQASSAGQPVGPLADMARSLSAGDPGRAIQLGTAYLKQHPDDSRAHVLMAEARIARGELDQAYGELRRALEIDPRQMDALYYLGLVSARLSEAQFRRLAEMAPDSPWLHQLLAESLEAQGQRPAASREYQAALDADPKLLPALLGLAKLKRTQLDCDSAIALYQRAEAIRPTFDGAYGLGVCQSVLQDDEAAVGSFQAAIKRDPGAAVAWVGLGTSLNKLRRPSEAIARLLHAIQLEPGMGEAYYALGLAYRANRQPDRAAEAFRKAEQLGSSLGGGTPQ